jgi:hypothetical protein
VGWTDAAVYDDDYVIPGGECLSRTQTDAEFVTYVYKVHYASQDVWVPARVESAAVAYSSVGTPTGNVAVGDQVPNGDRGVRFGPNPLAGGGFVRFVMPQVGGASFDVYDLRGQLIAHMVGQCAPGQPCEIALRSGWSGGRLHPGVYLLRYRLGQNKGSKKIAVLSGSQN